MLPTKLTHPVDFSVMRNVDLDVVEESLERGRYLGEAPVSNLQQIAILKWEEQSTFRVGLFATATTERPIPRLFGAGDHVL